MGRSEQYVGKDLKQMAFAYLKANTKIFIWSLSRSRISQVNPKPGHTPMEKYHAQCYQYDKVIP